MAAYPSSVPFKTTIRPLTRVRLEPSESGVVRGQSLSAVHAYEILVEHPFCTAAQVATLQSFFSTNEYADNTIPGNDGNTYDCWFLQDYQITPVSGTYFNVTTRLAANRQ